MDHLDRVAHPRARLRAEPGEGRAHLSRVSLSPDLSELADRPRLVARPFVVAQIRYQFRYLVFTQGHDGATATSDAVFGTRTIATSSTTAMTMLIASMKKMPR